MSNIFVKDERGTKARSDSLHTFHATYAVDVHEAEINLLHSPVPLSCITTEDKGVLPNQMPAQESRSGVFRGGLQLGRGRLKCHAKSIC